MVVLNYYAPASHTQGDNAQITIVEGELWNVYCKLSNYNFSSTHACRLTYPRLSNFSYRYCTLKLKNKVQKASVNLSCYKIKLKRCLIDKAFYSLTEYFGTKTT